MDTVVRDLDADMAVIAGHRNVADASTVALIAEALETGAWSSPGIRSAQHWVRLHLGASSGQARMLCTVASRFSDFPDTMAVFITGALSLAQMEVIVTRAPVWADHRMGTFAQGLSVAQCVT